MYSLGMELLPGTLYLLILRTLRAGPLHGYGIAKRIKEASEQGLDIEDSSALSGAEPHGGEGLAGVGVGNFG